MPAEFRSCEHCSQPARVLILERYSDGAPRLHACCLVCADLRRRPRGTPVRRMTTLAVVAGVILGLICLSVDWLGFTGALEFGQYQLTGVVFGLLVLVLGGLTRVDALLVMGAATTLLAATADYLGLADSHAIGWKQQFGLALAVAVSVAGLLVRAHHHYRNQPSPR